jgi:16S rRNA (guanine527-N7)-methyltransferase
MLPARISELLAPFLDAPLAQSELEAISTYVDLLLRWNARINLTAIRTPDEIVTRHFGESLFAARHLFPRPSVAHAPVPAGAAASESHTARTPTAPAPLQAAPLLIDLGSGAGFPGLPIKLWAPHVRVTLIESNQKKVVFLREVARCLTLTDINVLSCRAENYPGSLADVVTLRAVEQFDRILPVAGSLVVPGGRLALLIGGSQLERLATLSGFTHREPIAIPNSRDRHLALADKNI